MASPADDRPPALVLGAGVTALGVLRILGRRGIPAFLATPPDPVTARSRWYQRAPMRGAWEGGEPLEENLARVELDRAVLVACSDSLAMAVAERPPRAGDSFLSFQPPAATLCRLVDKGEFVRVLRSSDVPHPRTYLIDHGDGLDQVPDPGNDRPLFLKPRDSQSFFDSVGAKAFWVQDRRDLEARVRALTADGHRLMLQEYVPGPPTNHYFVDGFADAEGELVAHLVRQRLRMYPPDFGNSTSTVTVSEEDAAPAVGHLRRLLRRLSYRGIFSAEFKRDAEDGEFRILEINARPWWYVEFAARAGVDVVSMTYDAALGREPSVPRGYEIGRRLVYPYYDLHACLDGTSDRLRGWGRFLRDGLAADHVVFAWDDPLPAFRHWARVVSDHFGSRVRRGRRWPAGVSRS